MAKSQSEIAQAGDKDEVELNHAAGEVRCSGGWLLSFGNPWPLSDTRPLGGKTANLSLRNG